ncbi:MULTISPECIES: hypothetical protein [unclassified Marinobacter]|uniref:hypothetical protein n=1 Tax=unclassified Marinobacter TaxID=83889 RepID=UPI001C54FDB5
MFILRFRIVTIKAITGAEVASKPERRIRGDSPVFPDNSFIRVAGTCSALESALTLISSGFKYSSRRISRMNGAHTITRHFAFSSVITSNFNIFRAILCPSETHTPLLVCADALLTFAVSLQQWSGQAFCDNPVKLLFSIQ